MLKAAPLGSRLSAGLSNRNVLRVMAHHGRARAYLALMYPFLPLNRTPTQPS